MFSFWSPLLDCDDGDGCCACCFEYGWWWCTTLLLLLLLLCMCTLLALLSVGEPGEILPARAFNDWSIFMATGSRRLLPSTSFILEEDRFTLRFRFEGVNPQTPNDHVHPTIINALLSYASSSSPITSHQTLPSQTIFLPFFPLSFFPLPFLSSSLLSGSQTQKAYTVHEIRMHRYGHQFVSREVCSPLPPLIFLGTLATFNVRNEAVE